MTCLLVLTLPTIMSCTAMVDRIRVAEGILHQQYIENIRCKMRLTERNPRTSELHDKEFPIKYQYTQISVSDGNRIIARSESIADQERRQICAYWDPEIAYIVNQENGKFQLMQVQYARNSTHKQYKSYLLAMRPLNFGAFQHRLTSDQLKHDIIKVIKEETTQWNGQPAVAVTTELFYAPTKSRIRETGYFDPSNHYAALGYVSDYASDKRVQGGKEYRIVVEMEYQPSALGYPVPKRLTDFYEFRDGTKFPVVEVEYLSFEKYEPSPEDFTLEAEYGLVTPVASDPTTHTTTIAQARRWPWYLLIAGVAVMAVLIVAYWRRRRVLTRE